MLKCMHTQTCMHVHTHGCTHVISIHNTGILLLILLPQIIVRTQLHSLGDEVPGWDVTNDLSRQTTALHQIVCGYLGHG